MVRTWRRDRRASVTVLFAIMSAVIFAVTAIALDLVTIWTARRSTQGAVDLAALLAAAGPGSPDDIARRSLSDNAFARDLPSARTVVGTYTPNPSTRPADRFVPGGTATNAVRVSFATTVRTSFSQVVGLPSVFTVSATATARSADFASFTLGSGLLSLNDGVANALLSSLLGTTVSLNVMDYNALAGARVDALTFLDALAVRANLTAASYDEILAARVTLTQAVSALQTSIPGGTASQALASIVKSLTGSRLDLPVSSLLDLGDVPLPGRPASTPSIPLNVLGTLTNAIALANGANQVSVDLGASVPGLLRTKLVVLIGARRQSSGPVQPGSTKATLRVGQMRALVEAKLSLPLGTVTLPIYLEAANAVASLASITCPWSDPTRREVGVDARPGVIDLAIASLPATLPALTAPTPSLSDRVTLLSLPLVSVSGRARVTWASPLPRRLVFNNDDITTGRVRSASSSDALNSIVGSLISNLQLDVNGIDLSTILGLQQTLRPALEAVAAPLDDVIGTTLRLLGIRIGYADVSVDAIRCGRSVLVE